MLTAVGGAVAGTGLTGTRAVRAQTDTATATSASAPPTARWTRRYAVGEHAARFLSVVPVGDGYVLAGVAGGHDDLRGLAVRTDERGRTRWQRTYGTVKSGVADGAPHPDGGVVLAGGTNLDGSSPFAETPLSADPWVIRLDRDGDVVWTRTLQPAAAAGQADSLVRVDGGFLVAGRRRERREHRPRPWVAHLSPAGHRRWATTLGKEDEQGVLTAAGAVDDAWYVGGSTSPATAGGGQPSGRDETGLVVRLDPDGSVRWRWSPGGPRGSRLADLRADASGVVCVGNRGFATDNDGRGWHLRLDADGGRAWEATHSRGPWNWLDGLAAFDEGDGYLLVGTREHPPEGDDPNGRRGAWVLRTGPAGEVRWATTYVDGDRSHGETVHALDGGFLLAGSTGTGADEAAWLVGVGAVPAPDTTAAAIHRLDALARAVPPAADEVGLGVLVGAGVATLGRRLRDGE
jgi:hypothetical protein